MNLHRPTSRHLPPGAVGALIAAIGFGVALWHGWEQYRQPPWTAAEIDQSVALNLALDLARRPGTVPSDDDVRVLREQIRREVNIEIARERERTGDYMFAGLLVGLVGAGQMAVSIALRPR